jgi:MoxR-like ATPase
VAQAVAAVATTEELAALQTECRKSFVDPDLIQYAVRRVTATRDFAAAGLPDLAPFVQFGASPRATIHLIEGARALGFLRGRDYVLPEDVTDLVPDVLRHRIVLSYEALAEATTADDLIARVMRHIPPPAKPMKAHAKIAARS